jgi:hypothetical protein
MSGSCSAQVIGSYLFIIPFFYILYLCIYEIFFKKEQIDPKTGLKEKKSIMWQSIGAVFSLILIMVFIFIIIMGNRPAKIESTPTNVNINSDPFSSFSRVDNRMI